MIISMPTTARPQRRYDHRLRTLELMRTRAEKCRMSVEIAPLGARGRVMVASNFAEHRTFVTNHRSQIMAADLFVVPTVTFRLLFVLVILAHDRRRIVHVAVTAHPTSPGRHNNFATPFQRTRLLDIYSTIAIRSLPMWQPPPLE